MTTAAAAVDAAARPANTADSTRAIGCQGGNSADQAVKAAFLD